MSRQPKPEIHFWYRRGIAPLPNFAAHYDHPYTCPCPGAGEKKGMRVYVHTVNRRHGLVAVQAAAGFTIVEIQGTEPIGLGDWLEWQDDCLVGLVYRNRSKAADHSVILRAHGVHPDWVRLLLQL